MPNNAQALARDVSADTTEPSSEAKQRKNDRTGSEITKTLKQPPEDLTQRMEAHREKLKMARTYMEGFGKSLIVPTLEVMIRIDAFREANEATRNQLNRGIHDQKPIIHEKNLRKLVPCFRRFDWRTYNVVPRIRVQKDAGCDIGSCWAYTATEAFESALMIQRAKFPHPDMGIDSFLAEQITLNVNSVLEGVGSQGRHEDVFDFYLREGIPLDQIGINDVGERDAKLVYKEGKRSTRVKAVAWNWASRAPWRIPARHGEILEMKKDLLEHGPLVVMVRFSDEFRNYGTPTCNSQASDDDILTGLPSGMSLRFPSDAATFEKDEKTGRLFLNLQSQGVKARSLRNSHKGEDFLEMRFPAGKAPALEPQTKNLLKLRPTDCDDAVIFNHAENQLRFTANNGVVMENDPDTGEVIVRFPANTDAEFNPDPATNDLIATFPTDKAPVFRSNKFECTDEFEEANHYVLLIGWDDDKDGGSWIVQNTYHDWGYQCNGPNLVAGSRMSEASEDRGYMYIAYGHSLVGQFAAWIEAPLLRRGLWRKKTKGLTAAMHA